MISLKSFWTALPAEGRWLLSTVAISTLGRGLVLPFTLIYLHEVRGFGLGLSGVLMATIAVAAFVVTGPSGALTDRYGARAVMLGGQSSMVLGTVLLAFATTPASAAVALVLVGVNFGSSMPAFNSLIATVVEGEVRQQYFGVNFALINLGLGVGGIVGGLFADVARPETFTAIYLADATSGLIPLALFLGPLRHVHGRVLHAPRNLEAGAAPGYRTILRSPAVRWLTLLTFVATFIGYGQFEVGLPAFARGDAGLSTEMIGVGFALNTFVIVAFQFTVMGRIRGRRRTRVLSVMALLWAAAWLLMGAGALAPGSALAVTGLLGFGIVFGIGETLLQPTLPAINNDLAPDHLRGRYNALNSAAVQAATVAGPVVAGLLLERGHGTALIALMVLGCGAIAVVATVLERHLPATVNGRPAVVPEPVG
ncbi:MFS transporter [Nocardioides daeguensis]|uniref:MFS transporter n=1 Tax=Nocardioides daeguensis TaxID=908359 RepID=A0ABP6VYZ1_9ACTN|nr:MFS transporter [Nocardioides daeguensis]MBV6726925.1 MFS transporter [Nocardioides daeguensis]MCR1772924.1 MFS transporter [Nocardioides daeguensis]